MGKTVLLFLVSFSGFSLVAGIEESVPLVPEISRKALLTIIEGGPSHPNDYYISERSLLKQHEMFFKEGGTCTSLLASLDGPENPDLYEFPPPLGDNLISKCATKLQKDYEKELNAHLEKSPVPVYFCRKTEKLAKTRDCAVRCRKIN